MSLRPRYSLLTLLLLTAAVAGGIKYWRGPHWAELRDPPTQEEKAVLEQHSALRNFLWDYGAEEVRYQYMREGQGSSWHLLEGRVFQRPVLITLPPRQLLTGYPWAMPLKNGWQPIVYWIAGVEAKADDDSLYLLAEDQNVYRMLLPPWEGLVPFPLHEIDNPAVRGRLEAEIVQLRGKLQTNKLVP